MVEFDFLLAKNDRFNSFLGEI